MLPILLSSLLLAQTLFVSELKPATLEAFQKYVAQREAEIDSRNRATKFLWLDEDSQHLAAARSGKAVVQSHTSKKQTNVASGMIQDWIGGVFVPGATLDSALRFVQSYDEHRKHHGPEVQQSKLISRNGNRFHIFLRLRKEKVITVFLNTYHDVDYFTDSPTRAHSISRTTRINEVEHPGTPKEKEYAAGVDHGFLWRLNSYWRFLERDGGVYIECEAISLTRDVPYGFGFMVNPILQDLPAESMEKTLLATKKALERRSTP